MATRWRSNALAVLLVLGLAAVASAQPSVVTTSSTGILSGGSTDVVITAPSGVTTGDLLVACITGVLSSDTGDISGSGWTHVETHNNGSNKLGMAWKAWDSGDGATYTLTGWAGSATARRGFMWRISNADTTTPSDATATQNSASSTARTYTAITTATANSLALGCVNWATNDVTYTPEATLTNDNTTQRLGADHKVITAAGSTGTLAGSGTNTSWTSIFWAVKVPSAPPGASGKNCMLLGVC
jgi:hypothetical protein